MSPEVKAFNKEYSALVSRMTDSVHQLILMGRSKEEILTIIAATDFKNMILKDKQFQQGYHELNKMYLSTLKSMKQFADITPEALAALTKVNQSTFMGKLTDDIASTLKSNLTNGVLGGLNPEEMIAGITSDLRPDQVETLITTALSNYPASLNSLIADQLPDKASYVYTGPVDQKTRKICLALMSNGPMTKKEIQDNYPGRWIGRGGFNCRHQWQPFTRDVQFYNPTKATAFIKPAT